MTEGHLFTDIIPYPRGSHIERQRIERRSTRLVLEELGAQRIQVTHLIHESEQHYLSGENQQTYAVSGIIDNAIGTLPQIQEVLRKRGGRAFSHHPCSIDVR